MKSLLKTQTIVILIIFLFLALTTLSMAEPLPQEKKDNIKTDTMEDEPDGYIPSYYPVEFNMMENNGLTPELPHPDATDASVICPNGFVPNWWSVRKRYGRTEWRDVGTWETIRVSKGLRATGAITFSIWVTFSGSGNPGTSNFEFHWIRNDETISTGYRNNVDLESGMEPMRLEVTSHLVNQTPFEEGDIFRLKIRCQVSLDGARILYGSRTHRTLVQMTCDPLNIISVSGCRHSIKALYEDVFRVSYTRMTFTCIVDTIPVITEPTFGVETILNQNYNAVLWEAELRPGTYNVEVGISYLENDNTTMVFLTQELEVKETPIATLFGLPLWQAHLLISIIVLIVLVAITITVYNKYQERKWLAEMDSYDKK